MSSVSGVFRMASGSVFRVSLLLLLCSPAVGRAQSPPAPAPVPLGADAYVAIVLRAHPAGREAQALLQAAEAEKTAGRVFPDPWVEYARGHGTLSEAPGTSGREHSWSVTQTLPWPGSYSAGVKAADRLAESLTAEATASRWGLEIDARAAFERLVSSRALAEVARAAEADAAGLRDLVVRRADLGEARESDRIKATVEWLQQRRDRAALERQAEAAEAVLRALAVETLPRPLALQPAPAAPIAPVDDAAIRTKLHEANPRLVAARAEEARREAGLSRARQARVPDLDVTYFQDEELDKESSGLAAGLRIPLWNANRGEVARALAEYGRAQAVSARIATELEGEMQSALRALETASDQVALLESDLVPAARRSVGLVQLSFSEGETSLLDLLDAQRTARGAERELVESRLALALAVGEVRRLVGPDFDPGRRP
jgi:cobalt-zinc-cadmium efflux system outer membrane protein